MRDARALLVVSAATIACAGPPATTRSAPDVPPPALEAIAEADLRRDVYALAGDAMRGREAATLDEMRATAWVAERAREAGLEPAGEDGTYFQFWPLRRARISSASRATLGGEALVLGRDAVLIAPVDAQGEWPVVAVGVTEAADGRRFEGQAVLAELVPPKELPAANVSLRGFRYARNAAREQGPPLAARGAAAVILVADSTADAGLDYYGTVLTRGTYALDSAGVDQRPRGVPVLILRRAWLERARRPGQRLALSISTESFVYPSANVVARVRGTNPALGGEYVLFSAHQDHDGIKPPVSGDSIWNGADDNATAAAALLAIGRAWKARPARRSALFVWHGAEEKGLLGSRWHAQHPMVPREQIVAVLNADMIGRNHPDSSGLLGSQPPHRNSTALVDAALDANRRWIGFAVDSSWDRPTHPEGFYFRSDHLPYARAGVPAIFFTSQLHPDYHTPRDEPATIDYRKLTRIARWMYATGWMVANGEARPGVDPGFRLER
ncbi:MAG TPA: M28 family peptidase [Gemmatimonadaceae bacterium]|nr:M28 family peptidase [Gemmatimonadaceae bacterium]